MLSNEDLREAYTDGFDHGYMEGFADGEKSGKVVEVLTKGKLSQLNKENRE